MAARLTLKRDESFLGLLVWPNAFLTMEAGMSTFAAKVFAALSARQSYSGCSPVTLGDRSPPRST